MIKKAISNLESFRIIDDNSNDISYGCNQDWYATEWQRRSGCGPTVGTNIILSLANKSSQLNETKSKHECLLLMEKIWRYVTPTNRGINTIELFYQGMIDYAKSENIKLCYSFCNVDRESFLRPKLANIINHIEKALDIDVPVAFLNLDSGEEKGIEKWHWVTIVSLEYLENRTEAYVEILDNGELKKIDLALWYNTTRIGGGFVNFKKC